ncbi:legumin1 [Zea mays]|uniref:Legumin1 n=1 Tax=Zea mays TaxID=4577 RepID=A0A1D6LI03_MAIZE|nr:legumin1 [Zea mays]
MAAAIVLSGQVRPLPSSLPLSLLLLLLLCCSGTSWGWSTSRGGAARECGFDGKLEALEPRHKVQSEAGSVQYFSRFNEADRELTCAGIFAVRVVVDAMGLLLPRYSNVHSLVYIVQGRGIIGFSFPGCQEETQQQQYGYGYGYGHHHHQHDHHKIHRFEQGDVVAMPAGAQHWLYNDGDAPLVAVYVFGEIVRVEPEHGFHQLNPSPSSSSFSFPSSQVQYQTCQRDVDRHNVCAMEVRHSVERLDQADVYSPGAGRITRLTSHKFPVLNLVQMSAVRVDLYQDAIMSPFWNFNAHSAMYGIRGSARVQVASDNGTTVFDDVLRAGQLLIVPQGYLVATKAQGEGFQYIAFETNPDTMVSHVAGKNSVLSDLPAAVIASSYAISMEEAAELKNGRKHELAVLTPAGSGSYQQGQAGSAQQ